MVVKRKKSTRTLKLFRADKHRSRTLSTKLRKFFKKNLKSKALPQFPHLPQNNFPPSLSLLLPLLCLNQRVNSPRLAPISDSVHARLELTQFQRYCFFFFLHHQFESRVFSTSLYLYYFSCGVPFSLLKNLPFSTCSCPQSTCC